MTVVDQPALTLPTQRPVGATGVARRNAEAGNSVRAISGVQRAELWMLTVAWIAATIGFWSWWLGSSVAHESTALFVIGTIPLAYVSTVLPTFYWYFVTRARVPEPRVAPTGMRVAVITPCVPSSESSDVVELQLRALAELHYPCDTWLLDEGDRPELRALAAAYGVRHFSRRGHPEWNQPAPPFKAKTKAGNVNAWIDHVLHERLDYDVFIQLDIDHRPRPDYLDVVLGHFDDPSVGWVQAPSVSGNLDSWTARGQAEQETALQGPLQMGFYGHSRTPFIIGSHTSYRMSAIREIGGYQPTRAEDHLDTVVLAAHGYRGVYVPEIIAVGDGPDTFSTYLGQQFAWAYSMAQIFLRHTPHLLRRYAPRQVFQFLMAQSWYTLWSVSCAVLWAMPIVGVFVGHPVASVAPSDLLVYYGPVLLTATLMWWWSRFLFQPRGVGLSWRWFVLEAARWPVVLWAIVNAALRIERPYMITPKGKHAVDVPRGRGIYGPYLVLSAIATGTLVYAVHQGVAPASQGLLWLVLTSALANLAVVVIAGGLEARTLRLAGGWRVAARARGGVLAATLVVVVAFSTSVVLAAAPLAGSLQ